MDNNTISAFHITKRKADILKLNTSKLYKWHIPKELRDDPIQKGDIVLVDAAGTQSKVLVMDVFREDFEETNRRYKKVVAVIERAPEPKQPIN
ncbi:hypothetical protein ShirakiTB12_54330 [Priestia megaterium]|uniref:Uncharacterized protein n=1 Tax=Priestia megaterium TaxID=1404 RepID=A0AAX6BTB1_PRIMG|nr:DUF5839 family protein [Priestia megaterium]GMG76964.1 hypothetical protein ShirakiTB12_54330 [Priestia megaterium]